MSATRSQSAVDRRTSHRSSAAGDQPAARLSCAASKRLAVDQQWRFRRGDAGRSPASRNARRRRRTARCRLTAAARRRRRRSKTTASAPLMFSPNQTLDASRYRSHVVAIERVKLERQARISRSSDRAARFHAARRRPPALEAIGGDQRAERQHEHRPVAVEIERAGRHGRERAGNRSGTMIRSNREPRRAASSRAAEAARTPPEKIRPTALNW